LESYRESSKETPCMTDITVHSSWSRFNL